MNKILILGFLIIGTVVLIGCTEDSVGGAIKTPGSTDGTAPVANGHSNGDSTINAHLCSADSTCEVNNIKMSGNTLELESSFNLTNPDGSVNIQLHPAMGNAAVINFYESNNGPHAKIIYRPDTLSLNIETTSSKDIKLLTSGGGSVIVGQWANFKLNGLTGEGNAFACLDSEGVLFRSNEPCR